MENSILSRITDSYFDKMFAPLLESRASACTLSWSVDEVEKATFALLLLVNFADIAKRAYHEKCCQVLQISEIHNALSMAMLNGSKETCSAIFQMSRFEHFPQDLVAKQIATANKLSFSTHTSSTATDNWYHFNTILKTQHALVGKPLEERMHSLIKIIEEAQKEQKLHSLATSHIVELFSYERDNFNISEQNMRMRLEQTSHEITHLTQRLSVQNVQLQEYRELIFEKSLKEESLESLCTDLKEQKKELKKNMSHLIKKLSEKTELYQKAEKRLLVSASETQELNVKYKTALQDLKTKTEQYDKLLTVVKDHTHRIDSLKKTVAACDVDIKEKERRIEEAEKELARTNKLLEEQHNAKKSANGIIATLEKELREKNEQLEQCEQELRETDELRKTILSLMENKKRKR